MLDKKQLQTAVEYQYTGCSIFNIFQDLKNKFLEVPKSSETTKMVLVNHIKADTQNNKACNLF